MNAQTNTSSEEKKLGTAQIHLSDYIAILKKRKRIIIIFALVLVSMVTVISLISTPLYEATVTMIIERQPYPVNNAEATANMDIREQEFFQSQYDLLQSRSLALKVIEDFELWKDFHPSLVLKVTKAFQSLMPSKFNRAGVEKTTRSEAAYPSVQGKAWPVDIEKSDVIDWYLDNLKVKPVKGSRLIDVSFMLPSAEKAARVANAHAHAFIERSTQTRLSSARGLTWLVTQIQEQKKKMEDSQRALQAYKKASSTVSFEDRLNIVSQQLLDLSVSLTKAQSERTAKQTVYEQLKSFSVGNENIFSLPEVAQDSIILNLRNQLIQLKAKRLELASNYGPKHPKIIDLDSRITQTEQEIAGEVKRLSRAIKADLDRAIANEKAIKRNLDAQKNAAQSVNEKSSEYEVLKQESQSNQQIYDTLIKQAKEIGLASALDNINISIIDEAEVPLDPAKPNILLNILLSIVLSIFMGPFVAFFFEYMDRTVKTPGDVFRRTGMTVLGAVPFYRSAREKKDSLLMWDNSYMPKKKRPYELGEMAIHFIPSLPLLHQEAQGRALFIQSAVSGEGKTTVLANCAIGLARSGLRVLMIDADTINPSLHTYFGIGDESGLVQSMERILSQKIQDGSLNRLSVDDLFFLIGLKKLSGNLTITNVPQAVVAVFEEGRLLHLQSQDGPLTNRLGTMLVRGGLLSESQLEEAIEVNVRTGKPLGYVLINAGFLTQEKLQGPLKLQIEEHLQKVFSWKQGTFAFEPMDQKICGDEKIYFGEDYSPIIRRLGRFAGNPFIEGEIFSKILTLKEQNLSLLPSGGVVINLNGPAYLTLFEKFLEILKRRCDIIFIDNPPLLDLPASAVLSSVGDGVIFVVKAGNLPDKKINDAVSCLHEAKSTVTGMVLNQVAGLYD